MAARGRRARAIVSHDRSLTLFHAVSGPLRHDCSERSCTGKSHASANMPRAVRRSAPTMSAACCARPRCDRRSAIMPQGAIDDDTFAAIAGPVHPRRRQLQEDAGLEGRHRRRIPPRLLLGPLRRAHRGFRDQARRASNSATITAMRSNSPHPTRRKSSGGDRRWRSMNSCSCAARQRLHRRSRCRRLRPCISSVSMILPTEPSTRRKDSSQI